MDDPCTAGRQPTSPIPRPRLCSTDPIAPPTAPRPHPRQGATGLMTNCSHSWRPSNYAELSRPATALTSGITGTSA